MTGARRAGLVFGGCALLAGLLGGVLAFGVGLLVGPLVAAVLGAAAGFFGASGSGPQRALGQGARAGALVGGGVVLGSVLFALCAVGRVLVDPQAAQRLQAELEPSFATLGLPPRAFAGGVLGAGVVVGGCLGIVNLVIALAGSLAGAWHAAWVQRRRS